MGDISVVEGKRVGKRKGTKSRLHLKRDISWAYRNMNVQVAPKVRLAELDMPLNVKAPSAGALAWWQHAKKHPDKFLAMVMKVCGEEGKKDDPARVEVDEQTAGVTELVDKLIGEFKASQDVQPRKVVARNPKGPAAQPGVAPVAVGEGQSG